jgi:hypothetical protein
VTQGRIHDFKLLALSNVRIKTETKAGVDSGYQGLQEEHVNTAMPTKKPKKKPLTKEQKRANREQSRERIPVENVIGCIKRFRILSERYRCRRKRFGLRINLISSIYNYELDHAPVAVNPVSK